MSFRSDDDRALLLAFTHWLGNHLTTERGKDWNEQPAQTVDEFLRQRQAERESKWLKTSSKASAGDY